ncbi:dna-directed rna polymerase alpha chain rpoa [Cystoisospora suis]|uniref:Dna-directed rna polymerase alpha chain rpoa n=1 Tax=Cystoisospora suis TaxID=483139 RepID=A0A2C6L2F7_9APIC|nr:dna-directed rna polymerase alpha chain rpoa [Cystoisospora suis]
MASPGVKGRRVYSCCRLQVTSLLRWFVLLRAPPSQTHKVSIKRTKLVSFVVASFVTVCLCMLFPFVSHALPLPTDGYPSSRPPVSSLRSLPSLRPHAFHSFSPTASLASPSTTSLRVPFHSAVGPPSSLSDRPRFSTSPCSLVKGSKHSLSHQAAERSYPRVFLPVAHGPQQPLPWQYRVGGVSPGAQSYLLSSNVVAAFSTSSPCSVGHPQFFTVLHNVPIASHDEASGRRLISQRDREWSHAGQTSPRVSRALFSWSLPSRLSHFEGRDGVTCFSQTAVLSRLHEEGGKDVARAGEQEAPYPSFIVPSPHPPPPARGERPSGQTASEECKEGEGARQRAEEWRVNRRVLELGDDELGKRIEEERREIQERWHARLEAEENRGQDQLDGEREEQLKLIKACPSPPWAYVFRKLHVDPHPPLKYDFRVYQPYFKSLIEASKPFIRTKIVPLSTLQRLFERRRSREFSLSSGFRFKQIQPLFAHNAGCSAFYYFHTCFSALAPSFLNALRRTSVCRIEALAITAVKIEGAKHEFYSLPGIREDIVDDIFNNLGKVIFREPRFTFVKRSEIESWLAARRGQYHMMVEQGPRREGKRKKKDGTAAPAGRTHPGDTPELPPGTILVHRNKKDQQKTTPGWMSVLSSYEKAKRENSTLGDERQQGKGRIGMGQQEEEDDDDFEAYYRIPMPPLPPANFTHPLRAKLRVKGPLVAVAGHIQLPEGVEILNKNQYLFTVNSGYYVNMDFKIERIMEYVMPEYGYDSLERDRDEEGFIYFTNHVSPIPIFAYAAERRGESVHTKWDAVDENAPIGEELPHEEEGDEDLSPEVTAVLRAAMAGAPAAVAQRFSPLLHEAERSPARDTDWNSAPSNQEKGGGESVSSRRDEFVLSEGYRSLGVDRKEKKTKDVGRSDLRTAEPAISSPRSPLAVSETLPATFKSEQSSRHHSWTHKDRYRFVEATEQDREAYKREYLENDLPYQNLGEVVTLEVQTDGSITPREGLLRCCDDLIQQALAIQNALYNHCYIGVDGNNEEEFDDPDWYQDPHRYVGVPWNPYKGSAARTQQRQDFFFKPDVLRQYNILREKIDQRREAYAAAQQQARDGKHQCSTEASGDGFHPSVWPPPGRGLSSDQFVIPPGSSGVSAAERQKALEERLAESRARLEASRQRLQQQGLEGLGGKPVMTYGLSDAELQERLLDEEEEEERIVNTSAIIRKERDEEWRDKQRMYRDLAENEPLKRLGDGKGLVRYPPDSKPMMEAPDWVMNDPMGSRMPLGFHEFNDD